MSLPLLAILGSLLCSINGQVAFKRSMNYARQINAQQIVDRRNMLAYLAYGGLLYGMGLLLWIFALSRVELSFAFPFLSLSYVGIILSARFRLGERVRGSRLVGACLIVAGVLLVTLSA